MRIQIVGMGCPRCHQMESDVKAVVAQTGIAADIGRIDDPQTIVQMGILSVPQLMVDGELLRFRYRGRPSIADALAAMTQELDR